MPSAFGHHHEATETTSSVAIDDTTPSTSTVYSGTKIETSLAILRSQIPTNPTETHGHFSINTNSTFYDDGVVRLRWDGFDELMITQTGLTSITDVYATAHTFTNAVSFPSSNPMILSTVENDFTQRSSAHFVDFTIRSDSDPSFPYYKIHYEVSSSTGTHLLYWNIKKYV
jgi:hypothetical protein